MVGALVRSTLTTAYVSKANLNGIPVGSDSNPGTEAAPFLTLDQAQRSMAAPGTIILNSTAGSPQTYICTRTIANTITIQGIAAGCGAIVAGNNVTAVALIDLPGSGKSVTFQDLIFDPSLSSGGASAIGVNLATQAGGYTVDFIRCTVQNFTTYGIKNTAVNWKGVLNLTDHTSTAGSCISACSIASAAAGSELNIAGTHTTTITSATNAEVGIVFNFVAAGAGCITTVDAIEDFVVTVNPAAINARYYGMYSVGCLNTWDLRAPGVQHMIKTGVGQIYPVAINRDNGLLYPISNSRITGASVIWDGPGSGAPIITSSDSDWLSTTGADNLIIEDFDTVDVVGGSHGPSHFWTQNSILRNGTVIGSAFGTVDKENTSLEVYGMAVTGPCAGAYIALKGGNGSYYHDNTVSMTLGGNGEAVQMTDNPSTGNHVLNAVMENTDIAIDGTVGAAMVTADVGTTATWTGNSWTLNTGTTIANPYTYLGVSMKFGTGSPNWVTDVATTDTSNLP